MNALRSFLRLERGEEWPALLVFLYLTLALTSYIIAKAVRDSLFLNQFSALALPYVYIGVAVLIGFIVAIYVRLSSRMRQSSLISGTLLFFIVNTLFLWWAARVSWAPISIVFYIWANIFGIIITAQVWTVASTVFDTRQAKRLFPLIGSGGILGGALGGLIATAVVRSVGTDNLLLALVLLLGVSIAIVQVLSRRYSPPVVEAIGGRHSSRGNVNIKSVLEITARSRYLRLIATLLALSAIVTLIIDFQFKLIVQQSLLSKDELTAFFGSFYAYVGLFSFLLQFLAGSRIVERYGVKLTLMMLPLALLGGTAILLAYPARLWAGILLKGSDGMLRYSIDKSTLELLYVPVPQSTKAQVKAVIDMVLQRLSDGIGGLLLLLMTSVLGFGLVGVGFFNVALLMLWVWAARETRKEYVSTVRASLAERQILPETALRAAFLEPASREAMRSMLRQKDEEVVLYAMELALAIGLKDLVTPDLFRHPSRLVRLKAVETAPLTDAETLERLLSDPDAAVRARMVARVCELDSPHRPMATIVKHLGAPDLRVRLASLACLAQHLGKAGTDTVRKHLTDIISELDDASGEWTDVAESLGEIPGTAALDLHVRLLHYADRDVRRRAVISAGRAQHRELVPILVRLLADRALAAEARDALRQYGARILGTLQDLLHDSREDIEVRRQIPLVLANIANQQSVDTLLDSLFEEDGLLRFRAIRALNKLRISGEPLRFDPEKISRRIREEGEKLDRYRHALATLYPTGESPDLLPHLLKDKINQGQERVFRLLALMLPPTAAHASYKALIGNDRVKRASAAEYLDNVLPRQMKRWVLPLVEAKEMAPRGSVREILKSFLEKGDALIQECTVEAIAKNRWPEFSSPDWTLTRLQEGYTYG